MVQTASLHRHACVRVGVWQCSPTVQKAGSVWYCLWGNALKRSPGIIRKSRVSYPSPGFLSSATWPSLPKKHYNGLNQTKPNQSYFSSVITPLVITTHPKYKYMTHQNLAYMCNPTISISIDLYLLLFFYVHYYHIDTTAFSI